MQHYFHYDVSAWKNTLNGCHGCAHGDSTVISQLQFVSLKNAMHAYTKWKYTHLSLLIKWHSFDIDSCEGGKYSLFRFFISFVRINVFLCVYE